MDAVQDGKIIQSVAKAMKLLDILDASPMPMSLAELSAQTGWPKSTLHGLLSTMKGYSVVAQNEDGNYMLGIRLFEYGCTLSNSWDIVEIAKPYIQHISYSTGEAVFLSILDRGEVITLDRADNKSGLWISAEMGCRLPVHCTSQGKLFLAYMSHNEQEEILGRNEWIPYTAHTITSRKALDRELLQIRNQGYATEIGEYKTGLRSVAAPIFDKDGRVRYAIGLISMDRQIETEQFQKDIQIVMETASKISEAL